jgi:hypothetical protein
MLRYTKVPKGSKKNNNIKNMWVIENVILVRLYSIGNRMEGMSQRTNYAIKMYTFKSYLFIDGKKFPHTKYDKLLLEISGPQIYEYKTSIPSC